MCVPSPSSSTIIRSKPKLLCNSFLADDVVKNAAAKAVVELDKHKTKIRSLKKSIGEVECEL